MFTTIAILDQVGEKPIPNQFTSVSLDSYFNTTILVLLDWTRVKLLLLLAGPENEYKYTYRYR